MSVVDDFLQDVYPAASALVSFGSAYFLIGEFPQIIFFGDAGTQALAQFVIALIMGLSVYEGIKR